MELTSDFRSIVSVDRLSSRSYFNLVQVEQLDSKTMSEASPVEVTILPPVVLFLDLVKIAHDIVIVRVQLEELSKLNTLISKASSNHWYLAFP